MSRPHATAPLVPDIVPFLKTLSDETRLAIVRLLAHTDLRVGEIVERLQLPSNLVSHHLRTLRRLGVLHAQRSAADARDIYYSLDRERLQGLYTALGAALPLPRPVIPDPLAPAGAHDRPLRVLFLCTHNSARSQLAEGILRHLAGDAVEVRSAGSAPAVIHPLALALLQEWGIDTSQHRSTALSAVMDQPFDYAITVCDRVREVCPVFPNDPVQLHWSLADPTLIDDPDAQRHAFAALQRALVTRIQALLSADHPATGRRVPARVHAQSAQGPVADA